MDQTRTDLYTLSLHDALPISSTRWSRVRYSCARERNTKFIVRLRLMFLMVRTTSSSTLLSVLTIKNINLRDRKSTRLNSSHVAISYAVFCLKQKTSNMTRVHT